MKAYSTYKKIFDSQEITTFLLFLEEHAIPYEVEDLKRNFNPTMTPRDGSIEMWVKIHPDNFEKVRSLETEQLQAHLTDISPDYYLFSFSEGELKDVLLNSNEWSLFDVLLAEKLLKEKGVFASKREAEELIKAGIEMKHEEKALDVFQLIIVYCISIAIPFLGLILGYHYATHKKTLLTGERIAVFTKQVRFHGKIVATISGIQLIFLFITLLFFNQ